MRVNPRDRRERLWLLVEPPDVEVCAKPPGFPEDVVLSTTSEWLARWHMGRAAFGHGVREGLVTVAGRRAATRLVARWGGVGAATGVTA